MSLRAEEEEAKEEAENAERDVRAARPMTATRRAALSGGGTRSSVRMTPKERVAHRIAQEKALDRGSKVNVERRLGAAEGPPYAVQQKAAARARLRRPHPRMRPCRKNFELAAGAQPATCRSQLAPQRAGGGQLLLTNATYVDAGDSLGRTPLMLATMVRKCPRCWRCSRAARG